MPPSIPQRHPAIFLDRDGVIIENRADYVKSLAEVRFIPGALAALARAARQPNYRFVVVTNQSAIGRGLVSLETAAAINAYVRQQVEAAGGRLDGFYVCPHVPEAGCACRKPAPGMLLQAAEALGLDLPASVIIGDALTDIQAGHAAGTRALLVQTGLSLAHAPALAGAAPGLAEVPRLSDLAAALDYWLAEGRLTKTPPTARGAPNLP